MMAAMSDWSSALERRIEERTAQVAVVGMGYVGLSLALELGRTGFTVRGIDLDLERVNRLNRGESYLVDVPSDALGPLVTAGALAATTTFEQAAAADVIIICVPTPLGKSKEPDISFILSALEHLLPHLHQGQLMVLESTTYPGTMEEVIQPRLESRGLVIGADFFLAFSPERVDPGNQRFTTANIPKVVGGVTRVNGAGRGPLRPRHRERLQGLEPPRGGDGQATREHLSQREHRSRQRARARPVARSVWTPGKSSRPPPPSPSASCRSTRGRGSAATAFPSIPTTCPGRCG
jgi:nucleoside-diphosphate-sugar epimerase